MSDYTKGVVDGLGGFWLIVGVAMFVEGTIVGWPIQTDGAIPRADAMLWAIIGLALLLARRL